MSDDGWYRRSKWTEIDREEFDARLYLCPIGLHRAQYLRIQAAHLADAGFFNASIELLDRMIVEYPEPFQIGLAHLQKAESLVQLGREDEAIRSYRSAVQSERDYPSVRTRAWEGFARFVIGRKLANLYQEVVEIVREFRDD
jgi:tetratricopeptide (TPR) repeat protein